VLEQNDSDAKPAPVKLPPLSTPTEETDTGDSTSVPDPVPVSDLTPVPVDLSTASVLPETTIVEHVPGWTLFENVYMSNGTLLILSSSPVSEFPDIRYMTSTGLVAENTPENIAAREPTPWNMDFVTPEEALQRWGKVATGRRVWSVEGNTVSI